MSEDPEANAAPVTRRSALLKLIHGFALGAGFGIGMAAVLLTIDAAKERLQRSGTHETTQETVWQKRFTPEAKLIVEHHEPRATRWNLVVLGSVRNDGAGRGARATGRNQCALVRGAT